MSQGCSSKQAAVTEHHTARGAAPGAGTVSRKMEGRQTKRQNCQVEAFQPVLQTSLFSAMQDTGNSSNCSSNHHKFCTKFYFPLNVKHITNLIVGQQRNNTLEKATYKALGKISTRLCLNLRKGFKILMELCICRLCESKQYTSSAKHTKKITQTLLKMKKKQHNKHCS